MLQPLPLLGLLLTLMDLLTRGLQDTWHEVTVLLAGPIVAGRLIGLLGAAVGV